MNFKRVLSNGSFSLGLNSDTKEGIIEEMVDMLVADGLIKSRDAAIAAVLEREKKMSTGIGSGIAVPHCRTKGVRKGVAAFARVPNGVNFVSVDKEPVKLVFLMLSPKDAGDRHIRALARISRILGDRAIRSRLLRVRTARDIYRIIAEENAKRT